MKRLLSICFMLLIMSSLWAYQPLTREEADNYLMSIPYEKVLDIVIDYDYIEHTIPVVSFPYMNYALVGNDLVITPLGNLHMEISKFAWEIPLRQTVQSDFYKPPNTNYKIWIGIGVGTLAGFGLGYLIGNIVGSF